jgi:hypothetical protein
VASLSEVQRNLASDTRWRRPGSSRAPFEDTLPAQAPDRIALLRLDTDWYSSTRHELVHLFPRLCPGGVLIVDDYGHWQGCRQAVDEFVEEEGLAMLFCRIDYTGRIAVKPRR